MTTIRRTLFTTEDTSDARRAGFDTRAEPGADGGFSVVLDLSFDLPSVEIVLTDGAVTGAAAIRQLADALAAAVRMSQ